MFEKLDYVILVSDEMAQMTRFYHEILGFEVAHDAGHYVQFIAGETRLGLHERSAFGAVIGRKFPQSTRLSGNFELGFKVISCDAAFEHCVAHGANAVTQPTDRSWGQRTAYIADPDGNLIELAEDTS